MALEHCKRTGPHPRTTNLFTEHDLAPCCRGIWKWPASSYPWDRAKDEALEEIRAAQEKCRQTGPHSDPVTGTQQLHTHGILQLKPCCIGVWTFQENHFVPMDE